MGHARAVATAPDLDSLTREIVARGLSVRQAEATGENASTPGAGIDIGRASARNAKPVDTDLLALERQLGDMLGLTVKVAHKGQGGAVTLPLFEPRSARHDLPAPVGRADLKPSGGA